MATITKITSITIKNYRAYYGDYNPILLASGQNLLIYGENGSGKSSLFKALNNYLASSRNRNQVFVKNYFDLANNGSVEICFEDFDDVSYNILPNTTQCHIFSDVNSNTNTPFLQNADLIKGFLDYTNLLDVYLHKEDNPNLFELIVLNLLGETIPVSSGGNFKFSEKWQQLQKNLVRLSYTRQHWIHRTALAELPIFEAHLRNTLNLIFAELNRLLRVYFFDLNIQLNFQLQPLTFNYTRFKSNWYTTADLRLQVIKDGVILQGNYRDTLNEARLSAFAICLYLASLLRNPASFPFKILYLDDVFIGLDAGNRYPILNIILNEFSGYQVFVSTYDRHWFELAKHFFSLNKADRWSTVECYVGFQEINNSAINKPIIVVGESYYEKAIGFLHHRSNPDYAASANYFRKAIEQLIKNLVPYWEKVDTENTQLPDYQLTNLLYRTQSFLSRTDNDIKDINVIIGFIHVLIHPLSHHDITSQIYKTELQLIDRSFCRLEHQLKGLDIPNNFKSPLAANKRLKMTFEVNGSTNHFCHYELILRDPLVIFKDSTGQIIVANANCWADRSYGHNGTVPYPSSSYSKKDQRFNYYSLEEAYNSIYTFLITTSVGNFPRASNYLSTIQYHDGNQWQPLSAIIVF